jgi:hypothetical protein
MAQAVSLRPLTVEARVRSQLSPCRNCGGQCGTGTGFSPNISVSPVNSFHSCSIALKDGKTDHVSLQGCTISLKAAVRP